MNIKKLFALAILTLFANVSYGGEYNCTGGTPAECTKSCVSIGDCQHPCTPVPNPSCKADPTPAPGSVVQEIQKCEIISIYALGYTGGNIHEFCTKEKKWNGGEVNGMCWKFPNDPKTDCPRLNSYYQVQGQPGSCDNLSVDDAFKLHVCGH